MSCSHKSFTNRVAMSETSYGRSLSVDRCFQHHQKGRQLFSKMQTSHLTLYKDSFFNPFSCIKDIKCHNSRKKSEFYHEKSNCNSINRGSDNQQFHLPSFHPSSLILLYHNTRPPKNPLLLGNRNKPPHLFAAIKAIDDDAV